MGEVHEVQSEMHEDQRSTHDELLETKETVERVGSGNAPTSAASDAPGVRRRFGLRGRTGWSPSGSRVRSGRRRRSCSRRGWTRCSSILQSRRTRLRGSPRGSRPRPRRPRHSRALPHTQIRDHVCGIAAFPAATATMSEAAAARLFGPRREGDGGGAGSGERGRDRRRAARRPHVLCGRRPAGGAVSPRDPRASRPHPGRTAFRCRDLDLLAVGDYLSTIEFPFVTSTAAYRGTLAALIDLLRHDAPGQVIPGHGPELTAAEALVVAEADLGYLRELQQAVAGAATREDARAAGLAVSPRARRRKTSRRRGQQTSRLPWPSASSSKRSAGDSFELSQGHSAVGFDPSASYGVSRRRSTLTLLLQIGRGSSGGGPIRAAGDPARLAVSAGSSFSPASQGR